MTADMRFLLRAFPLLGILLLSAATDSADWDFFSRTTKEVCPGLPTSISGPGPTPADREYDLYFKSHIPDSSEVQITNGTHALDPTYLLKKHSFLHGLRVYIPEVMKQHEGVYYWRGHRFPLHKYKTTEITLKDCSVHQELSYGTAFKMAIPIQAAKLEFTPSGSKDQRILWSRINADFAKGEGGTTEGHSWLANGIRFADAGLYAFCRESGAEISSTTVKVTESESFHDLSERDSWEERMAVPVSEAVVTFVDNQKKRHVIFKNRMVTQDALKIFGGRLSVTAKPDMLQLNMKNGNYGTVGRYEVTVKEGRAFVIHVRDGDDEEADDGSFQGAMLPLGMSAIVLIASLCCCMARRCCSKMKNAPPLAEGPSFGDPMVLFGIAANVLLVTLFCCVTRRCCKGLKSALPPAEGVDCPVTETPTSAPRPDPAYQPGARSQVEHSPTAPCYDGPPPSYEALMGNMQSWLARGPVPMCPPYTPLSPDSPPEARAGAGADAVAADATVKPAAAAPVADGTPAATATAATPTPAATATATAATLTPAAPSAPSAPEYQHQPSGWSTEVPDGVDAATAATPAASSSPSAPSAPPDYQYQPRGLSETTVDFLSGSPLNTNASDTTVYNSDKLDI